MSLALLAASVAAGAENIRPPVPAGGPKAAAVQWLVPGFASRALPLQLPNINSVRYRPDGKLFALAFDGRVYLLSDTDGDGLEDRADIFHDPGRTHLSLNLALTPPGYAAGAGVFIARKGQVVLELDTDGDDRADREIVVADNWEVPRRYPGGTSDAIGLALDAAGNLHFGLGAANSQNGYLLEDGVASYRLASERGALLRMPPDFSRREIVATGIRAAFGLAFNAAGDLFATDQEGATWMPNGNPFDELLHLQPGRHYGFPPRHPRHLPGVIDEPSVVDYGPQHQSTCGLCFNEPAAGGRVFGPDWWRGDAFVAGASRGKLFRTKLVKTPSGYVGQNQVVACLGWLTIDQAVSPGGDLVVSVHSGPPDWGTGATGRGRLFKLTYRAAAQPVLVYAESPTALRIDFDAALPANVEAGLAARVTLAAGHDVREGDRFEAFRPGYRVVREQRSTPRLPVAVRGARLSPDRRSVLIETARRPFALPCSIDIEGWPRSSATLPDELPQVSVLGVAADATGVDAEWVSADGAVRWSGWLPHFDLQVALELSAAGAEHARLWPLLRRRGTLTLRGQLDLWSMLRPAVQPGARLDHTPPAEYVTVNFAAASGAAPTLSFPGVATPPVVESSGRAVRIVRHPSRERGWLPVTVTLATGGGEPGLHVSWTTAEDDRPRALALRRVWLPWAAPAPPAAPPAAPSELAGGDRDRGRELFALCAPCHRLDGGGSRVGPDLSNLVQRDYASVVRDIAEPSAAINPDYVAYTIRLVSGETRTAVLLENRPAGVLLAVPGAPPEWLPKAAIASMSVSPVSLMPPGLDQALGPQGLKDLLAYLLLPEPPPASNSQPPDRR